MWLAVILFCFILGLFAYLDAKKPKNYPPGPEWYPIIGCMLLVQRLRKETGYLYRACEELSRQYGPVVGLKVGKDKTIVCSGYEAVKELLTKEEFDGRPSGPFYEDRTWGSRREEVSKLKPLSLGCERGQNAASNYYCSQAAHIAYRGIEGDLVGTSEKECLLLVDEQFWVEQKRFVLRHLREFGFGKRTMSELVEEESFQLLSTFREAIAKEGGRSAVVPMRDAFSVSVLNTLWSMLAGIRYSPEDKELKHLQGLLTELFANIDMVGTIFSQFPFLRWLAPEKSGYKQFIDIHQNVWKFLKTELDNHKATFKADDPRDLMDVYLEMLRSKDRSSSFSESQLLAICMDMFMAGSETTSKSMGFGFLYLLYHPEVQVRAQEELDRVVGRNRLPTLNDRPEMPYMESIVLESVRMFMGRTFSIPHRALRDATIQGYNVPKGTMLIANFHHVLMSPEFWDEPELFKPERFINAENKVVIPDNYLPFGFGKHRCMGQALARSNIFLFTATLLQNFTFSCVPGQDLPSKLGVDGVTPSPGEFDALVTVRD